MDSRQSQGRQDRPLIHNPHHQPTPQPPHPAYSQYGPPPASQPPVHVPFSDPFQRRDPFLPTAQQRRDSYGLPARENVGPAWGNNTAAAPPPPPPQPQPPPPPPPQQEPLQYQRPHQNSAPPPPPPSLVAGPNGSSHMPYAYEQSRRRSLGGGSPPQYYGVPRDPPPPPHPFGNRQMPPPSSPGPQSSPLPPFAAQRGPPPPPPFSTGRDLPGLVGAPRPNSNMSISSLMGFEAAAANRQSHYSPPTSTTAPSPSLNSMQPPSPRRGLLGYSQYRRGETPDQYTPRSSAPRGSDGPSYAAGSPPRSFAAPPRASPEEPRQSMPPMTSAMAGNRPYSLSDSTAQEAARHAQIVPPRPNSQPSGPHVRQDNPRDAWAAVNTAKRTFFGPAQDERAAALDRQYGSRPSGPNSPDLSRQEAPPNAERPTTVQPISHSIYDAPKRQYPGAAQPGSTAQPARSMFWHPQSREPMGSEARQIGKDESRDPYRAGSQPTSAGPPIANMGRGPFNASGPGAEGAHRFPLGLEPTGRRIAEQYQSPPTSDPASMDRRKVDHGAPLAHNLNGYPPNRATSYDYQVKKPGEEMQMQKSRSFLGVSPEAIRRGRASPLPQAVQGAQGAPVGPGGDPSIKNEFGRMFSGLGSGLMGGHRSATPSRQSPFPHNGSDHLGGPGDAEMARAGSRGGRRTRKIKDEDGRVESESNEGRMTPGMASQRGSKRAKHVHQGHHHHHVYPHHHHHRAEEEAALPAANAPASNTPTPFSKTNGLPQNVVNAQSGHHHHHHHHHHHAPHPVHHHHHAPRANNVPAAFPLLTKPTVETNNDEPLNRVKDVPRNHLGSTVYEAQYTPLPSRNTSIDDRYGARLVPKPLPDDTGKEGCTRTIRVPRFYMSDRERDVICLSKNVWGTEIYTNDSDVVGAAMHSGWIRGAWSEDVDVSLLDPRIGQAREADAKEILTSKPANPVVPPPNMDAHITILILHGLTEYRSRVCYGVKSKGRKKHMGSSFKIERVQWVDDASTAHGEERTGKAQRDRIAAAQSLVSLLTGGGGGSGGVGGGGGGGGSSSQSSDRNAEQSTRLAQAVA